MARSGATADWVEVAISKLKLRTLLIIATRPEGCAEVRVGLSSGDGRSGERAKSLRTHSLAVVLGISIAVLPVSAQQPPRPPVGTPPPSAQKEKPSAPLTKDQAKELFRSVDEILQFASDDTKLPIEHTVKRKLVTRDEVNKYLRDRFKEDEGAKRLARSEVVLKKFGLLDRDFELQSFLISLLTEQVAGFYDDRTKTVNLLDWIEPDEQKPVLAHELTHALQDQKVGLTKWSQVGSDDVAKNADEDNQHIQTDEGDTARDAVAEGQAMVVFLDYTLKPTGKTLQNSPDLISHLRDTVSDMSGSPILARAPLLLQKSLLFPYNEGLMFEDTILIKKGKEAAFASVLQNPPSSTFEIMHPGAYLAHAPVPVLRMPDIHSLIDPEYSPYDVGVMGEFDVRILAELFGGSQIADALTPEWRGGIYYAAQKKSAVTEEQKGSTASLGLLYESKWKNEESARSFMRVYEEELPRKYSGLTRRQKDEADDDERVYSTSEGDVLLSNSGTGLFISEGFPLPLARKLRDLISSAQPEGRLQVADVTRQANDPGLDLTRAIASAGVMKVALHPGVAADLH